MRHSKCVAVSIFRSITWKRDPLWCIMTAFGSSAISQCSLVVQKAPATMRSEYCVSIAEYCTQTTRTEDYTYMQTNVKVLTHQECVQLSLYWPTAYPCSPECILCSVLPLHHSSYKVLILFAAQGLCVCVWACTHVQRMLDAKQNSKVQF